MTGVDHRAMNALALVQSFVNITQAETVPDFAAAIRGRVQALARAHRMLGEASWSGADLASLLAAEVPDNLPPRVRSDGPPVLLPTAAVQPLALVLHELLSNAARHGALAAQTGSVEIAWTVRAQSLHIEWKENGASGVIQPTAPGVGLRMLESVVKQQLGGRVSMTWERDGVHAEMSLPMETAL